MSRSKLTQSNRVFSLNNSCTIIGIKRNCKLSKRIFKSIRKKRYLFFRIKSLRYRIDDRRYFVVSNECLTFIKDEYEKIKPISKKVTRNEDFYVVYPKISLIHITNSEMDKKREISMVISHLKKLRIFPVAHKLLGESCCLLLNYSDSLMALGYLYDEFVRFYNKPIGSKNLKKDNEITYLKYL